jgi:hypothetical protein
MWGIQEHGDSVSLPSFRVRMRNVLVCRDGGGHSVLVLGGLETETAL